MKVYTNNHWRDFEYRCDVPSKILETHFDWTNDAHEEHGDYSDGFFFYRGYWYHLSEFTGTSGELAESGWHGYKGDSLFSGVAIRLSEDGEQFQVGTIVA